MPMVINYLRIQADLERAKEILTAIAEKKQGLGSMDFNAITPEPAWVYQGAVDHAARKEFGPENCWDLWRRKNWNTLYNAAVPKSRARSYGGGNLICFETRDTPVEMLIRKLSLIYPDVYVDYLWGSEDVDQGGGAVQYKAGERMVSILPKPGTRLAYEIAFDVLGTTPIEHGLELDEKMDNYTLKGGLNHERSKH